MREVNSGAAHTGGRAVRGTLDLLALAGLIVVFVADLHFVAARHQVDFSVYRAGGLAIAKGRDLYSLRVGADRLPFTYPPAAAAAFSVLTLVPVGVGQVAFLTASFLGLYAVVRLSLRRYATGGSSSSTPMVLLVVLVVALSDSMRVNLELGQINVFIVLLVLGDFCDVFPRIPRGVMTGLAAALKLTPLFLIVYFVAVRRYRSALGATCTFLAVSAVAYVVAPAASTQYWFRGYFADASRAGGLQYISNQSINGVLVRLTGSAAHAKVWWLSLALMTAGSILWLVGRVHARDPRLGESVAIAAILLLSPVSWVHHWILALPFIVTAFRLSANERHRRFLLGLTCALSAALWFGIIWHVPTDGNAEYHHSVWQFLVGNSDVVLLLATLFVAAMPWNVNSPDSVPHALVVVSERDDAMSLATASETAARLRAAVPRRHTPASLVDLPYLPSSQSQRAHIRFGAPLAM
jgi:alpha-1,2-mannosyltransferase